MENEFIYRSCVRKDDEGSLWRFDTSDGEIPVNILIDNADEVTVEPDALCRVDLMGVTHNATVYESEEAFSASNSTFAPISMVPSGTFTIPEDGDFEQSADILFTGKVTAVDWDDEAGEDEPNCCLTVETYGFTFNLYLRYDGGVSEGCIVHGFAWLFGDVKE